MAASPRIGLLIICIVLPVVLALLAALIVIGVVWLTRKRTSAPACAGGESSALTILKERYARGEITAEQYEQMKQDLEK